MGWLKLFDKSRDKWISAEITLMVPHSEMDKIKPKLATYAKEINWEIKSGGFTTHNDGIKMVNITIYPKGYSISPTDFLSNKDKILRIVDLIHKYSRERTGISHLFNVSYNWVEGTRRSKGDFSVSESFSELHCSYKLVDRLYFEKRNREMALELFNKTVEEDVKGLFNSKDDDSELKRELKKMFGFKF